MGNLLYSLEPLLELYREGMGSGRSHEGSHVNGSYSISHVSESHDTRIWDLQQNLKPEILT